MTRNIWIVADTHFGHANIIRYCNRPFASVEEMNSKMIANWNDTVRDEDIVYHLGDVYFRDNWVLPLLKGRKRLVIGNHDTGKDQNLQNAFQKIMVWRAFPEFGLLLTHVPVHPSALNEKWPRNVHGHIHQNPSPSAEYYNACVEVNDYRPINIEELRVK